MEPICGISEPTCSTIVDSDESMIGEDEKPEERQMIKDIYQWTNEELLGEILERLEKKLYNEAHGLIIAARDRDIVDIYLELFPAVIEKYDEDFITNGVSDLTLEEVLVLVKSYGTTKQKLLVLLEYSDRVTSWKAFLMLARFMEELMPEMKDLRNHANYDIKKVYIPSWIERLGKNIKLNCEDNQRNREYYIKLEEDYLDKDYRSTSLDTAPDLFSEAIFMFLRIFTLSASKDFHLLDELIDQVLGCMHIPSHQLQMLMTELQNIYKVAKRPFPKHALLYVNSIKSTVCSVPQILSPDYRLREALEPLLHTLYISTSNMFNVGYVVFVLRNYLVPIRTSSISRNELQSFLPFLANFLICCEEPTLCKLREVCMETFTIFLTKFEPVAQLLLIRKLISMIKRREIQIRFEPQLFAWLIDMYRSKLKFPEFCRELGYFWGDLTSIRYPRLSDALQFYMSVFIFAQEQSLRKINPELMLRVYEHYILPMQMQISDWTVLVETQERHFNAANLVVPAEQLAENMDRLEVETRRQQDIQSLPLIQFQYSQTLKYVETFLRSSQML